MTAPRMFIPDDARLPTAPLPPYTLPPRTIFGPCEVIDFTEQPVATSAPDRYNRDDLSTRANWGFAVMGYRIIHVEFIYPPIPDRRFDYQATFDGYDLGDPIGHGPNVQAAIDDLHEELEARE